MATVTGVINAMWEILKSVVPVGVDPVYFWATFFLTAGIIYILVQNIPQFRDKKGTAFIVAVVLGYFAASSAFATIIISKLFPNVGLVLMAILGLLLVIAFLSPESLKQGLRGSPLITIVAFAIILYLTYSFAAPELEKAGVISKTTGIAITDQDMAVIIIILIIILVIYFLVRKPPQGGEDWKSKFRDYLLGKEV